MSPKIRPEHRPKAVRITAQNPQIVFKLIVKKGSIRICDQKSDRVIERELFEKQLKNLQAALNVLLKGSVRICDRKYIKPIKNYIKPM